MKPSLFVAFVALLVLGGLSSARADVVGPPPASCPVGSTPSSSHSGPHCDPEPACTMDLMCGGGDACEEVRLCVVQVACGGRLPPDAGPCFEDHVVGVCSSSGACGEGTCRIQNACIVPGSARGGCACNVPSARASSGWRSLVGLLLLGTLLRARRSRARG